jgi:hypothetical protein
MFPLPAVRTSMPFIFPTINPNGTEPSRYASGISALNTIAGVLMGANI